MSAKFPRGGEQTHSQPSVYMMHYVLYLSDLIEYVVYGTVIQEVKTSNIAREVGIHRIHHYFLEH